MSPDLRRSNYSHSAVLAHVRTLYLWRALDIYPKVKEYVFGTPVPEEVYVDRLIRHCVREVYLQLRNRGDPIQERRIYELALNEYFGKHDGIIGQITRARLRLVNGRNWEDPSEFEYQQTIKVLLDEAREENDDGGA